MRALDEEYNVNDRVFITDFYLSNYPAWGKEIKDLPAIVTAVKKSVVKVVHLGKDEKPLYQGMYGIQNEYPLWQLFVAIGKSTYLVSQLGFSKEDTTINVK